MQGFDEFSYKQAAWKLEGRSAQQRVAHLLCELGFRIGTANGDKVTFEMPLTLSQIGNLIGLTPVHVSSSIEVLRGKSFVATFGRSVLIYNIVQLRLFAKYGPGFVH